jgi:hypothetical protein
VYNIRLFLPQKLHQQIQTIQVADEGDLTAEGNDEMGHTFIMANSIQFRTICRHKDYLVTLLLKKGGLASDEML